MSDRIHILAKAELQRTDWRLMRALERTLAGDDWCNWRDQLRCLVRANDGVEEIPPEPPFGVGRVSALPPQEFEAAPVPDPATLMIHDEIRSLMEPGETLPSPADIHNFPANLTDRLSDWGTDEASLTTADLTEEVIQKLTAAKRKKFTELLNVELAELQQERGGPREDLSREAEIEKLLGLFARVGEM